MKYLDFQSSHGKDDTPGIWKTIVNVLVVPNKNRVLGCVSPVPEREVDKVAKIHKVLYVMVPQEKLSDERLYGDFQLYGHSLDFTVEGNC